METVSTSLKNSPPVFKSKIKLMPLKNPTIPWSPKTSKEISIFLHKPVMTPRFSKLSSMTMVPILKDTVIDGWLFKSLMLVQLSQTRKESIATLWLEGIAEYGTAKDENGAISDLVISLGEYREVLEKREDTLGDSARKELNYLQKIIERAPTNLPNKIGNTVWIT